MRIDVRGIITSAAFVPKLGWLLALPVIATLMMNLQTIISRNSTMVAENVECAVTGARHGSERIYLDLACRIDGSTVKAVLLTPGDTLAILQAGARRANCDLYQSRTARSCTPL